MDISTKAMDAISCSNARARLAELMDRVNRDRNGVIITRQNGRSAVLMSLEDYESWQETLHLLRSPANAKRLLDSVTAVKKRSVHKQPEAAGARAVRP